MSTCCLISNAPSGASASPTTASTAARASCRSPTWTGSIRSAMRSWTAPSELGIPRCEDYNSGDRQAGVGYFQRAINRGYRHSAARVFLHPARRPGGWRCAPMRAPPRSCSTARVRKACAMSMTATAATQHEVYARREVIVSQRHREHRETAADFRRRTGAAAGPIGVPVVHELPVGENFRDHYSARLVARVQQHRPSTKWRTAWAWPGRSRAGRWASPASSRSARRWCTGSGSPRTAWTSPTCRACSRPASYKQGFVGLLDDYPGMTCGVWQHRPESIGYVRARSTDPFEDPAIQPNYLTDPMDRRVLLNGMKLARASAAHAGAGALFRPRRAARPGCAHRR